LGQRAEEMRRWPETTDCDRLDAAFEELNRRGVVARHDWWCCQNCGHGAMADEVELQPERVPGVPVRGYAFYHNQDTEAAVDGGGLFIAYGAEAPGDESLLAIGHELVEVLKRHGLRVDWSGSTDKRIRVSLEWQRRARPERWCEET
jgi:hypothetical protein